MRTPVTLDDDVAALVEAERTRTGESFRSAVNRLLRRGVRVAEAANWLEDGRASMGEDRRIPFAPVHPDRHAGTGHSSIAAELAATPGLRSEDVPDLETASLAIEHALVLASRDRGFRRFAHLRVVDPLA